MYDYKKLLELRKHTLLGLIALIKISREREAAEVAQILYNRAEHTTIGVDYSIAEKLEFDIRLEKWKKKNLATQKRKRLIINCLQSTQNAFFSQRWDIWLFTIKFWQFSTTPFFTYPNN